MSSSSSHGAANLTTFLAAHELEEVEHRIAKPVTNTAEHDPIEPEPLYGPESTFFLYGTCFSLEIRRYFEVDFCPFHNATQTRNSGTSRTLLGVWDGWDLEDSVPANLGNNNVTQPLPANQAFYRGMRFVEGESCHRGAERSAQLDFKCGGGFTDFQLDCEADGSYSCHLDCTLEIPLPCDILVGSRIEQGGKTRGEERKKDTSDHSNEGLDKPDRGPETHKSKLRKWAEGIVAHMRRDTSELDGFLDQVKSLLKDVDERPFDRHSDLTTAQHHQLHAQTQSGLTISERLAIKTLPDAIARLHSLAETLENKLKR
jgi:hypothetical protein